jgi:glucosamine--fructose-6-phosphate aminotransferase (isomerizing)
VQTIVLAGAPQTLNLNRQLVADIQAAGGQAALVQSAPGSDAFHLPECPSEMLPILEILPLQMGSLALAELQGFEPGRFRHATKVTSIQ